MIKIFNKPLPLQRNLKSDKYIYKSLHRGFIFDESHKKTCAFKIKENNYLVSQALRDKFTSIAIGNELIEVSIVENYLLVSYIEEVLNENVFDGLELVFTFDCSFLIILVPETFNFVSTFKGFNEPFFIRTGNNSGRILLSKCQAMNVWLNCIKQSIIPISISEWQRIALESNFFVYPFDNVNSLYFQKYEKSINKEMIAKYERTPKGKKVEININDLFLAMPLYNPVYFFFSLKVGSVDKNAFIYQNNTIVGRVIRGGFSFSIGKSRGLGFFFTAVDVSVPICVKNYNQSTYYIVENVEFIAN